MQLWLWNEKQQKCGGGGGSEENGSGDGKIKEMYWGTGVVQW